MYALLVTLSLCKIEKGEKEQPKISKNKELHALCVVAMPAAFSFPCESFETRSAVLLSEMPRGTSTALSLSFHVQDSCLSFLMTSVNAYGENSRSGGAGGKENPLTSRPLVFYASSFFLPTSSFLSLYNHSLLEKESLYPNTTS